MSDWWANDPVAPQPNAAAPKQGGNWWEADPVAPTPQAAPQPAPAQPYMGGGMASWEANKGKELRMSDILGGIFNAAKGGFDLANRAWRGELNTADPAQREEAAQTMFNAAGVFNPITPASRFALAPAAMPANPVAAASEELGIQVPKFVASENQAVKQLGYGMRSAPVAGAKITNAIDEMKSGMTRAADATAASLGSGERVIAGEAAKTGITNYITKTSRDLMDRAYRAVDDVVDPTVTVPLNATRARVQEITAQNSLSSLPPGKAAGFVEQALARPEGLTYEGIKGLRTRVGEMLNGKIESDISQGELKRIYGALTDDLANAARVAGGERGAQLWERANNLTRGLKAREEQLRKIVGEKADAPPEAVFDRLAAYASDRNGGNIQRLAQAKKAMARDDWDEVASAVIQRIGRDADGNVTPDRFATAYGNMSDSAKNMLFGQDGAHRNAIEGIAAISRRYVEDYKKFGNPSGTAQTGGLLAAGAGLVTNPITTLATVVGGTVFAGALSKPATASSMAKWAQTYEAAKRAPSVASANALSRASNNLAATMGDQFGRSFTGADFMRALTGPKPVPADEQTQR